MRFKTYLLTLFIFIYSNNVLSQYKNKCITPKRKVMPWKSKGVKISVLKPFSLNKSDDNLQTQNEFGVAIGYSEYLDLENNFLWNYSIEMTAYKVNYKKNTNLNEDNLTTDVFSTIGAEALLAYKLTNKVSCMLGYSNKLIFEKSTLYNYLTPALNYYDRYNHIKLTYRLPIYSINKSNLVPGSNFIELAYIFTF